MGVSVRDGLQCQRARVLLSNSEKCSGQAEEGKSCFYVDNLCVCTDAFERALAR